MSQKTGKKIILILQIFAGIGLIVVICLLIKAYQTKPDTSNLFAKLEMHELNDKEYVTKIDNQELKIKYDGTKTIINDKEMNFVANKVYITDKLLILSKTTLYGETIKFYKPNLEEIPFDKDDNYTNISLVDGKIMLTVVKNEYLQNDSIKVNNISIGLCNIIGGEKIIDHRNELEPIKDIEISTVYRVTYLDNLEVNIDHHDTINSLYLENTNKDNYCLIKNN